MRATTLIRRSLTHHWRVNLPVVLGAAVATSTLTGALVVGDSMRATLERIAIERLGRVDHAVVAQKFFREALAEEIRQDDRFTGRFEQVVPVIMMQAGATHAEHRTRAGSVNLIGLQEQFWALATTPPNPPPALSGRSVILNETLADELRAKPGDEILIRTIKPNDVSTETLLGRRDENTSTLRLTVESVVPARDWGAFGLLARQTAPMNAFVPLETLQRALDQEGRVNALLVAAGPKTAEGPEAQAAILSELVHAHATLDDHSLELRVDQARAYASLESRSILIPPAVESAAEAAAAQVGARSSRVLAHLANTIELRANAGTGGGPSRVIPYSTVAAIESGSSTAERLADLLSEGNARFSPGEILLNQWAAEDLSAKIGDQILLAYYVTPRPGEIETKEAPFTLAGILKMDAGVLDRGLVPTYPGVTDTENLAEWDAPFPLDLSKVRPKDEAYWDQYRTAPKAFVGLADGQTLWASEAGRFGRVTSVRVELGGDEESRQRLGGEFERVLLSQLDPMTSGLAFEAVLALAMEASWGATDFGMLFLGFSFFLIASAAMIVGLLFRLGVQRRANELGILLTAGFTPRGLMRQLAAEGLLLAIAGAALGLLGAVVYAWLMLSGLRTWWSAAVNAPLMVIALLPTTLFIGLTCSVVLAAAATVWAVRGMSRRSVRSLLAGADESTRTGARSGSWRAVALAVLAGVVGAAAAGAGWAELLPPAVAFFLGGTFVLIAGLAVIARWLATEMGGLAQRSRAGAAAMLALRNAGRSRGRSLLICSLIASAAFVIVALEAFRLDEQTSLARDSGTGGFALYAESAAPLPYRLGTTQGRKALGIEDAEIDTPDFQAIALRLRPGDATSCLNLYVPREPRILGAPSAMISRGGFRFAEVLEAEGGVSNPWTLLHEPVGDDGVIPAIGDEAAVRWQLHLGLGQELHVKDDFGRDVRLRFVALLKGSALQDEIIISEEDFERLFPSAEGHAFFLIETPPEKSAAVEVALERELERFGFDAGSTTERLASYGAVQNTYLSTFQSLGGLGLLLGTLGLGAIVLRNVWERRREFALLRALGHSRKAIGSSVLLENVLLVSCGLVAGVLAAAVAVAARVVGDAQAIPWLSIGGLLLLVLLCGSLAGLLGFVTAVRGPLVRSLRAE